MLMMFFFGWEKETERWPRSLVSLPIILVSNAVFTVFALFEYPRAVGCRILTSRSFNSNRSRLDVDFDTFRNLQTLFGMYVLHLECVVGVFECRRRSSNC